MAGYVRQSSFSDGDTIAASLLNNEYDQLLAAFNVSSGHTHDGSTTGDAGPISKLYSNSLTFGTNAEADITVNFNAASNDGVLTWMEDEDYFKFSDDVLVNADEKVLFRDSAIYIYSSTDGQLDLVADTEIQIAATTIDINGNVDISGTLTIGSAGISEAELEILDGLTATTTELNIMDGSVTTQATVTLVATDGVVISDADVMTQALVSDFDTYISGTTATLTNKTLTSPVINTGVSGTAILDEDNFASDSATKLATQQSIKAYISTQVSTGDITSVVAGSGLTGGATSGAATLNVIGGTGITANADDIAIDTSVVATLTGSQTLTNKSIDLGVNTLTGSVAEFNAALQSESFTTLTGSETLANKTLTSPVLNTGLSGTAFLDEDDFASDSATKIASQQSIKAYIATQVSVGDITSVVAGSGLTGGATSGAATLNVIGGTGITANADDIAIDTSVVTTLTGSQTLTNKTLTSPVLNTGVSGTAFVDEDDMSSNSATLIPTQQSVKAYVDAQDFSATSFVMEDGDGTEVTITKDKEMKFVEGGGVDINWTDTDNGTDGDPYDLTFTINAAQTGITSIYATDLILGEDSQTAIDFGTANEIDFKADNAARLTLTSSALYPVTNNEIDLGTASLEFKDAYFDGTVTADAFAGPLTGDVTGNTSGTAATVTTAAQSNITSLGTLTTLTVDNVIINGSTIGHTGDTDLITVASGVATVAGEVSMTTLDIGGTNVTSTAAELNIIDGDTSATSTTLADADRVVVNDNGTMKQVAVTAMTTYIGDPIAMAIALG